MTKKPAQIERISRSWAGHLATQPTLRAQLKAATTNEAKAALINQTIVPNPDDEVTAEDIEAIREWMSLIFSTFETDEGGATTLNRTGG